MFKIGDKVKVLRGRYNGDEGVVDELDTLDAPGVWVALSHGVYYMFNDMLELINE